ncbi:MAG: hypothetical protein JXA33_03910 [Anaerolineae bacterium]|nr:hypothetical protein [Anaerolineae bacterium]
MTHHSEMSHNTSSQSNPVVTLNGAGVTFILMGLFALALPPSQEGMRVWQLSAEYTFYLMDIAGVFTIVLGTILTWLGGMLWKRQLR